MLGSTVDYDEYAIRRLRSDRNVSVIGVCCPICSATNQHIQVGTEIACVICGVTLTRTERGLKWNTTVKSA